MDKKMTLVISSKKGVKELGDLITNIKETAGCVIIDIFLIHNDGVGLTTVYQEALEKSGNDVVLFVHDDIEFLRHGWGEEIMRLFEQHQDYGVIGVVGSAEFDSNASWWTYEKRYGQVVHRDNGNTFLSVYSPLLKVDLQEVCVIDGLFMAVHKQRISKGFDKSVNGFNFYDIDFCLGNFVGGKTKIGVTTNVRLAHHSVGRLKQNWYDNREIIVEKYKEFLPIKL